MDPVSESAETPRLRYRLEASSEGIDITLSPDFWDTDHDLEFDKRVDRLADDVRAACFTIAGYALTRH